MKIGGLQSANIGLKKAFSLNLTVPGTVGVFDSKVNAFISDNFKVGEQQAKLIADQMGIVWEVSSQSVHPSQTVFRRADAEFIIRSTAALLEYVSRLLN